MSTVILFRGSGRTCWSRRVTSRYQSTAPTTRSAWHRPSPPLSFVFDIDGVLLHGGKVLPEAKQAFQILHGDNPWKKVIPYVFLTNGGGISEAERRIKLQNQLGFNIHEHQVIQAHTAFKHLAHAKYADKAVLALGGRGDQIRKVAEGYGFKRAYTTLDVLAWNPATWPFHKLTAEEVKSTIPVNFSKTPIEAIFVYHDPRNWALDIQVICDVLQSGGIIGGPPVANPAKHVDLIFSNPDLLWRSDFPRPRFGQGAFKTAFQAVFKALTNSEYPYEQFGKPTQGAHNFAEKVLKSHVDELYNHTDLGQIYMVGDNPASDIALANSAGWSSFLVETGVYEPNNGPPAQEPTKIVSDVKAAVEQAIREQSK